MAQRVKDSKMILHDLDNLREELFPLVRRATMLYCVLRSLSAIQRQYQFTLPYFYRLFDEAVGGEFPQEYTEDSDGEEVSLYHFFAATHKFEN